MVYKFTAFMVVLDMNLRYEKLSVFGIGYSVCFHVPYSGYFSRGNIFVVFVVERRTTKYLPTNQSESHTRTACNTACARPKWVWF